MEESDLLLQLRTSFHLGNNYKVIELLKEHSDVTLTTNKDLALSILCRSIVKMGKNFVKYVEGLNIQSLKEDIQLSFTYLAPLNQEITEEDATQLYDKFKSSVKGDSFLIRLIESLLLLAKRDYESFLKLEKSNLDIEKLGMLYYSYLSLQRLDLCEKTLKQMKLVSEEDVLTNLCQVYHHLFTRSYEDALDLIEEMKGKFEDASKLYNLRATTLILMGKFNEAQALLSSLQSTMLNKEQFYDSYELEVALNNLIIISNHLGTSKEEYVKKLKEINPKSYLAE